ncbi:Glycoside hydrolase family 38 N-terminal domain-containing protein [Deinococcus saxicola]|uniref:glycoside hydrolase family 38 N-terminal domain-containing protein n=1 Tax=Deinococcus saxicola TaxID=249406 RepID=UPI0039EE7B53
MPELDTIYLVHHSHTDVGFTADQPVLWELQARFIDDALNTIERMQDGPEGTHFRWTCETTAPVLKWLETASARDIGRFVAADKSGHLEVAAMFANVTPLYNRAQYAESLRAVARLRDIGLDIRFAMQCDVNGQNWPLADVLLDAGIEGFSMAINTHFGGAPPRPGVFQWQAPSGRILPTFNGWAYPRAREFGIGEADDTAFAAWVPRLQAQLERVKYPLPFVMIQGDHLYGDNASVYPAYATFARQWNASGRGPKIVMATPRMFWAAVREHADQLEVRRGDWTDYWNFGCISTARETAMDRTNRVRLTDADAIHAALQGLPTAPQPGLRTQWAERSFKLYRDEAWRNLNLWGEHTWGADSAVGTPGTDDSLAQKNHKLNLAYTARSLSLLLGRDALADFSQYVDGGPDELLVFNPLPWPRTVSGQVPANTLTPRGDAADTTASRHFQGHYTPPSAIWTGRNAVHHGGNLGWVLPPTEVPAFGYASVPKTNVLNVNTAAVSQEAEVETARYRLRFDTELGGVTSLYDKQLGREWVDADAGYPLNGFVHEEVADCAHDWPRNLLNRMDWTPTAEDVSGWQPGWQANRTAPTRVTSHQVYRTPHGVAVEQLLEHPHVGKLAQRVFLPLHADWIECEAEWEMNQDSHPQATYLLFPFSLPGAEARLNMAGQPVVPGRDQLPGVCRDYFTVQGWADFNNGDCGVTVALPENPMVQLGNFHFGKRQSEFVLERPLFLGWITNNYWETNFQPVQPGLVTARYRLQPYAGPFDEARAHRFGLDTEHAGPLTQHFGEPGVTPSPLPASGTLLRLPDAPILTTQLKSGEGGVVLSLLNASDEVQTVRVASALLKIGRAWRCNLFGIKGEELPLSDGAISLELAPRRAVTLHLELALSTQENQA